MLAESCISPEHFERECGRVFRRASLNVGRIGDIPNAGDFFVRELAICKTSILAIRGLKTETSLAFIMSVRAAPTNWYGKSGGSAEVPWPAIFIAGGIAPKDGHRRPGRREFP